MLVASTPGWRKIDEILAAGRLFTNRSAEIYRRVLGELVEIGEYAERGMAESGKSRAQADPTDPIEAPHAWPRSVLAYPPP